MADIVLHQWEISPYCGKVRKALHLKGIAFRVENYNGLRAPQAAKLTPAAKLPVLDWNGERIADSSRICAFLDRQVPEPPLLPADPREAALARLLEDWADESLYYYEIHFRLQEPAALARAAALLCEGRPGWEARLFKPIFARNLKTRLQAHGFGGWTPAQIEAQFLALVDDLEAWLDGAEWLVGDRIGIADLAVSAQLDEIVRTSAIAPQLRSRPRLWAWLQRCTLPAPAAG